MADEGYDARGELVGTLLRKVEQDTYPSVTMLDMIEDMATPEQLPAYVRLLVEKVQADTYPSLDMIRRIRGLL